MRKTRRTEVTIETDRVLVIKKRKDLIQVWCTGCGRQVKMVSPDEAAAIAHVSSRTIYRWVEAGKLHFAETAEGFLLICPQSLLKNVM